MSRISQKILAKPKVYMDKEYDLGGGELELIRIYKPTVADWNWFQSKVADASAEGQKVSLPPDIYADIVLEKELKYIKASCVWPFHDAHDRLTAALVHVH